MTHGNWDVVIAGGGLGGAALGRALAMHGARVLIAEHETTFKDRVRGEGMLPWGVAEARALGIEGLLRDCGAREVRWWKRYLNAAPRDNRDLIATTPTRSGCLNFYHPSMQQTLLDAAQDAGAVVWRGATVVGLETTHAPALLLRTAHGDQRVDARLVVGADGRRSALRRLGGFAVNQDPSRLIIAGVLHEGVDAPEDEVHYFQKPSIAQSALLFPLGNQRFRSYFIYGVGSRAHPVSGNQHVDEFIAGCVETGVPREWYANARLAGPLAAFPGADNWVDHPYRNGVALIGDAAAASDPSWGCGLSLTLRDVRVLRDCLLANNDWDAAAADYAQRHDVYYGALHRIEDWLTQLMYETGELADKRRAHVLPRFAKEPDRAPDLQGRGPDSPSDEAARRRFFAEDVDVDIRSN
jgi:2-polyprenyl-6-methoxyphenol hydroxylase-like FAD-dependent oxidoreductase